ncbi:hypothetical protein [Vibrio parahaemolyticus]|uniref:hypothetical protein n=1 Tax=Vibrio parahaemolyticus TaxID=670 RepID=UPI0015DE9F84|nr:hypothetical protein [Vibrio parahaemolyticus]
MINKAKVTLLTLGVVLAGCSSVTAPKKDAIKTQAQLDRFEAFVQRVQSDDSGQLITELIEVTDWGCSNGNYLEEMDMFIQEVQK